MGTAGVSTPKEGPLIPGQRRGEASRSGLSPDATFSTLRPLGFPRWAEPLISLARKPPRLSQRGLRGKGPGDGQPQSARWREPAFPGLALPSLGGSLQVHPSPPAAPRVTNIPVRPRVTDDLLSYLAVMQAIRSSLYEDRSLGL
jgi:hypothetical protein